MLKSDGSGTVYKRGEIWWVYINGKPTYQSSGSSKQADATKLRDKLIAQRHRGELKGGAQDRILIGELLDDLVKSDIEESTRYVWGKVVEKSLRPFFGKLKAVRLSTDTMDAYRVKRKTGGVLDATVNRELSMLRTAFHNARKRTPPKVNVVPYFPMVKETFIRQGFLSDESYERLLKELPSELKALFASWFQCGVRRNELFEVQWPQVDWEAEEIVLEQGDTKGKEARTIPIVRGDMWNLLQAAWVERNEKWPESPWVFSRAGIQIRDCRGSWAGACKRAGVPDLLIHDMRRTAVRNMRRAGIPQVVRMKISGHKTDSMERRYSIVDADDLSVAKKLMADRKKDVKSTDPTDQTVAPNVTV